MTFERRYVLVGLGAIVALGLASLALTASPEHHGDGQGPLASLDGPGSETMAVDPIASANPTSWTYGLRLCLASGSDPAVISSIAPTASVGSGYQFLGAGIRQFLPTSDHTPVISLSAWPPPAGEVPDALSDTQGYAVTTPCADDPLAPYTELMIGLGLEGADGGGWQGIDIAYSVAGQHRVVSLDHNLFICGPSVAAHCSGPGSS